MSNGKWSDGSETIRIINKNIKFCIIMEDVAVEYDLAKTISYSPEKN